MSMIAEKFRDTRRTLIIAFLVAGDPDPASSILAAEAALEGGADILELGVPYSDPVADGPTIQKGHIRALRSGTRLDTVFSIVRTLKSRHRAPIVLLVYYNMVFRRGISGFCREAKEAGADGLLVVDMPPEESDGVVEAARETGLDRIFLVSETTSGERLRMILSRASGFLYLVSRLGVTGVREELPVGLPALVQRTKLASHLPVAVGFGISSQAHVKAIAETGADGAIVGSAIVRMLEEHEQDPAAAREEIRKFVAGLRRDSG